MSAVRAPAASHRPAAARYVPLGAHLVGSIPLASAEAVLRAVSDRLGDRLRRLPDGETGPRADWIVWQYPVLSSRPQFEVAPPAPQFYFCHGHDEQTPRRGHRDLGRMVEIANALAASLDRPLNWVHIPLARAGADTAFLEPLRHLRLQPETELSLGALHAGDSDEETQERVDGAHEFAGEYGLATACGWGRLAPARVPGLVEAHVRLTRPIAERSAEPAYLFRWPDGYVVHEVATGLVRTDERWAAYRPVLDDPERMQAYLAYRDRVFLAPRPLDFYLDALRSAGFSIVDVSERTIEADVDEWYEFLAAYADAVLGWVGGSVKVDGEPADETAATDRLGLLHEALDVIFGGRPTFQCCWTYITGSKA